MGGPEMEGASHARLRRLASAALDPRRIRGLLSRIEGVVGGLLDDIEPRMKMEFISELATPLPVFMIAELLGWPAAERHRLRPWSARIVSSRRSSIAIRIATKSSASTAAAASVACSAHETKSSAVPSRSRS